MDARKKAASANTQSSRRVKRKEEEVAVDTAVDRPTGHDPSDNRSGSTNRDGSRRENNR